MWESSYPACVCTKYSERVDKLAKKGQEIDMVTLSDDNALVKFTLISQKSGMQHKIPEINVTERNYYNSKA